MLLAAALPSSSFAQRTWTPPLGIPRPDFGMVETAPPDPSPWNAAVPNFYYVDASTPGATDSNNPYGWPARPRATIPPALPAGAVVELRGTYSLPMTSPRNLRMSGTPARPVFVRGGTGNPAQRALVTGGWEVTGTYFVVENIKFAFPQTAGLAMLGPLDHGVVRHCEVSGNPTGGGVGIGTWSAATNTNAVIYDCVIHDNGDVNADFDQDIHGIQVGWGGKTSNVWIVDNEFYRNSGDGIQIASGNISTQATLNHIYVGRNLSHHNKQTGMWAKQAVDVIFSQNTIYGHRSGNSSYGQCAGFQYATEQIWFLFNHIFDCEFGIAVSSDSGQGSGKDSYYIGNVIHNIHAFSGKFNPGTAWSNAAFMFAGGTNRFVVNNTIYDVDGGLNSPDGVGSIVFSDNIIAGLSKAGGAHVFLETRQMSAASRIQNLLLGEAPRIRWGNGVVYTNLKTFQGETGKGKGTSVGRVTFQDPAGGDFHLRPGTAGASATAVDVIYGFFEARYGLDIRKGADGVGRGVIGAPTDIGAYQGTGEGATGSAPAPRAASRPTSQ